MVKNPKGQGEEDLAYFILKTTLGAGAYNRSLFCSCLIFSRHRQSIKSLLQEDFDRFLLSC
jgi:hypothetical protein